MNGSMPFKWSFHVITSNIQFILNLHLKMIILIEENLESLRKGNCRRENQVYIKTQKSAGFFAVREQFITLSTL